MESKGLYELHVGEVCDLYDLSSVMLTVISPDGWFPPCFTTIIWSYTCLVLQKHGFIKIFAQDWRNTQQIILMSCYYSQIKITQCQ